MAALGNRFARHMGWKKDAVVTPPAPVLALDDEATIDAARVSQQRTRRMAAGKATRRTTLLTGPSGLADIPMQRKTLLGS